MIVLSGTRKESRILLLSIPGVGRICTVEPFCLFVLVV